MNNQDLMISTQDLIENPAPRVAICLVLDSSQSMKGDAISELNKGVQLFLDSIKKDEIAAASAEIAIVSFGGKVQKVADFVRHDGHDISALTAQGDTPMGEAVNLALDLLDERKRMYQSVGNAYYQPWMVLMTDGAPTDDISYAAKRTSELVNQQKLTVFPIGVGEHASLEKLRTFSPKQAPAKLKGLEFSDFFEWLSASVALLTSSGQGTKVTLPAPTWVIESA